MFSAFFPAAVVLEFPNAAESEQVEQQERSGGRKTVAFATRSGRLAGR